MAEKAAEKEVKKRAEKAAKSGVSKRAEAAARSEVMKASAAYKKDIGNTAAQMTKKQYSSYKKQKAEAAKHGVDLIPPMSKKVEEEKLLYILKKDGPAKALADAVKDVLDAEQDAHEAIHLFSVAKTQEADSYSDVQAMKTPAEKTLAKKVASDALAEVVIAKELKALTKKNLKTQQAVKEHTDKIVKDYEAGKNAQIANHGKEVIANKHAAAATKLKAASALAQATCAADKKVSKKALKKATLAEKRISAHVAKVDTAIGKSGENANPTAGEQDTEAKTTAAKGTARKYGASVTLLEKALKIAKSLVNTIKRALAESLVVKARAAKTKAAAEHGDATKAAHKAASKHPDKAKAAHDNAKIKRETEIQYKLGALEASEKAVQRDMSVVVKLKTASAAQAAIDMKQLASDLKKTPKLKVSEEQKAKLLVTQAKAAQKAAEKCADKAIKAEHRALNMASSTHLKTEALDLMKKTEEEEEEDVKEIRKQLALANKKGKGSR